MMICYYTVRRRFGYRGMRHSVLQCVIVLHNHHLLLARYDGCEAGGGQIAVVSPPQGGMRLEVSSP